MTQSTQMIETLDDCFVKTADNIMKHYGKILARLEIHFIRNTNFFSKCSICIFTYFSFTFAHLFPNAEDAIVKINIYSVYLTSIKKKNIFSADKEERKKILEELRDILKENCSGSARIVAANEIKKQLELTFDPESRNVEDIIKVR